MDELSTEIAEDEVIKALKSMENRKAAGLDGIPYEFYKILHQKYKDDKKTAQRDPFNIIGILTKVYQDIENNGTDNESENRFAEG